MIDLYFWPTSNNKKVTIMLHEVGLPYRLQLVNFIKDENYRPDFLALNKRQAEIKGMRFVKRDHRLRQTCLRRRTRSEVSEREYTNRLISRLE